MTEHDSGVQVGDSAAIKASIEQALADVFDEKVDSPFKDDTVHDDFVMDSLTAVECLSVLDELLDRKMPISLVKKGGYSTKDEFVSELTQAAVDFVVEGTS